MKRVLASEALRTVSLLFEDRLKDIPGLGGYILTHQDVSFLRNALADKIREAEISELRERTARQQYRDQLQNLLQRLEPKETDD